MVAPLDGTQPNHSPRRITRPRGFRHVCIVFISSPGVELCRLPLYCACIVRFSCCIRFSGHHTGGQHVFSSRGVQNKRCAASMVPNNTTHAKYTQKRLDYWFYYVFGVDLRRESGFINVICAFLPSSQRQFACFVPFA